MVKNPWDSGSRFFEKQSSLQAYIILPLLQVCLPPPDEYHGIKPPRLAGREATRLADRFNQERQTVTVASPGIKYK